MARPDEERPQPGDDEQVYGLAQLLALSYGVYAFALTLLLGATSRSPHCPESS